MSTAQLSGGPSVRAAPELDRIATLAADDAYAALASDPGGLDEPDAATRLVRVGPNRIEEVPGPTFVRQLLEQFVHLFALLLWIGALLALVTDQADLAVAIVAVIVVNGVFGLWQEHRAERAVAALRRLLPQATTVLRAGRELQIAADTVVPGDVLLLSEGDRVPADARLVDASSLRLDESTLTGEAHPVFKTHRPEPGDGQTTMQARTLIFAGSSVVNGSGRAVVISTGMATEFGRIARLTQRVREAPSPLQVEVARVARQVALLSVVMGITFFGIGYWLGGLPLRDGAIFAVGIVIANVPEGLLPTMTLALALGVQRMARRNAIVKRLSAVETLGSCTVICTDKTGTITENRMTVRELWVRGRRVTVTGTGYEPRGELTTADGRPLTREELVHLLPLLRIGSLCNTARLEPPGEDHEAWRLRGDPTEGALLVAAAKAGLDRDRELELRPFMRQLGFDPVRKRMSTIHRAQPPEGLLVNYAKGAPRELLEHCGKMLVDGRELALTGAMRGEVLAANDRMAQAGLRVLGMAYRYLTVEDTERLPLLNPVDVEEHMVFVGLAGMQDAPRPEVRAAIRMCRAAGIRVVMITGDYGLTAESIGRAVELLEPGAPGAISGAELEQLTDQDLIEALRSGQTIFSRVTPEQKLRIVTTLQAMGEIVAVTGDGVNDAPALKRADIGVAMGVSGTDVAREAADMILVDDNFATIVAAVEEGRAIFDNMRKFIVYIFAHLAPEAIPFAAFALFRTPLPLTVMQILAIDLGTETLPALALGVERAEPDIMQRPPRSRSERLLSTGALIRGYGFLGVMEAAVVLGAFFWLLSSAGWGWGQPEAPTSLIGAQATTVVFLGIVLMQVGSAFACRTERASAFGMGLLSNRFLLWGIAFELVLTALLIYLPPVQGLFGTAALNLWWWLLLAGFVPLIFLAEELRKLLVRRRLRRASI